MPIDYPQRWLEEHKAGICNIGWYRPVTYEILKCQKGIAGGDPIDVEQVFIVAPETVNVNDETKISVKFLPRVATETDYELTISDETFCEFDADSSKLKFKEKPGKVTITVTMKTGGATATKEINIRLAANSAIIKEGNAIVIGVEKEVTIELKPTNTSDTIKDISVDIRDNKYLSLEDVGAGKCKLKSDYLGTYYINVYSDTSTFKVPVYVINSDAELVTVIDQQFKAKYKFNEVIQIAPTFTPNDAIYKSYNIVLEDSTIAQYYSARDQIVTKEKNGTTKGTILMNVGGAKLDFNIVVEDDGVPPGEDKLITKLEISGIPDIPEVGKKYPYTVTVTPTDATDKTWTPTATNEATVTSTYITFTKAGSSTLTVTANDAGKVKGIKTVNAQAAVVQVSSLEISGIPDEVIEGTAYPFTVNVLPANATDKTYTMTGGNGAEISGNNITFSLIGASSITATANDAGKKTATKNVTVKARDVLVTKLTISGIPANVETGKDYPYTVAVEPANADINTWTPTVTNGATIDKTKVRFVNEGATKITVTADDAGKSKGTFDTTAKHPIVLVSNFTVTGVPAEPEVDSKFTVSVVVLPANATDKTYTTTTSANVSIVGNEVTCNTSGPAWIDVKANDTGAFTKRTEFTVKDKEIPVTDIEIEGLPTVIEVGKEYSFNVNVIPNNATNRTYSTNGSDNISINNNKLVANSKKAGSYITATSNSNESISDTVNLDTVVKVSSINITGIPAQVEKGSEVEFVVNVLPVDANDVSYDIVGSSNITITGNKFIANSDGASYITATARDGSGVSNKVDFNISTSVKSISVEGVPESVVEGETVDNISITVSPTDATDKSFIAETGDQWVATVSPDGKSITGVGFGTTDITYTSVSNPDVKQVFNISVKNVPTPGPTSITVDGFLPNMAVNDTVEGWVTIFPLNAEALWTCSTSDASIISFEPIESRIILTAVAVGTATITVTADKDTSVKFEMEITVS